MSNKKPWSKLKKEVTKLWIDDVNVDIHQAVYRMDSQRGSTDLPRYFVTLNKEIIFDYPKMFLNYTNYQTQYRGETREYTVRDTYPHINDVSELSELLRTYIDTPKEKLLNPIEKDIWGITDVCRALDKRLGKAKLESWAKTLDQNSPAHLILKARFSKS